MSNIAVEAFFPLLCICFDNTPHNSDETRDDKGDRLVCEFAVYLENLLCVVFLAVPLRREGQLYRWPRHSLTNSSTLLKNTTIEHSERLVTLETCDQSDEET